MQSEIEVVNAYTGDIHKAPIKPNLSLGEFQALLAGISGVQAKHQVLLAGPPYTALKRTRDLHSFHAAASSQQVKHLFLFNKVMLSPDAPEPGQVLLQPQDFCVEPLEPSGFSASEPMQQALIKIEANFAQDIVAPAKAYVRYGRMRAEAYKKCVDVQWCQAQAMEAASLNLEDHCKLLQNEYSAFEENARALREDHQQLLGSMEEDLQKLRQVPLHPALWDPACQRHQTLYDCMPVEKQREFARKLYDSQARLLGIVDKVSSEHQAFEDQLVQLQLKAKSTVHQQWAEQLRWLEQEKDKIEATLQAQEEELERVLAAHRVMLQRISEELHHQGDPSDSLSGLSRSRSDLTLAALGDVNRLADEHKETVTKMQKMDDVLLQTLSVCGESKSALNRELIQRLKHISQIQNTIKGLSGQLSTWEGAWSQLNDDLGHVRATRRLPEAYRSFLREVVRHRTYARVFEKKVCDAVEKIAEFRQTEVSLREAFLRESGSVLPKSFLAKAPALAIAPPPFAPTIPPEPETSQLPRITAEDLKLEEEEILAEHCVAERASEEGLTLIEKDDGVAAEEDRIADLEERCTQLNYENLSLKSKIDALQLQLARKSSSESAAYSMQHFKEQPISNVSSSAGIVPEEKMEMESSSIPSKSENENSILKNSMRLIHRLVIDSKREENLSGEHPPLLRNSTSEGVDPDPQEVYLQADEVIGALKERIRLLKGEVEKRDINIQECGHELERLRADSLERIVFRDFRVDCVALFMPILTQRHAGPQAGMDSRRMYLAFHIGCPHRFLSEETINSVKEANDGEYPDFILARIVEIEKETAGHSNPFDLKAGTVYYIVTAAML